MGYYQRPKPVRIKPHELLGTRTNYAYKLIHMSHFDHVAWHPAWAWTQWHNAKVYTWDQAAEEENKRQLPTHQRQVLVAAAPGVKWLPNEGVWCVVGTFIPLIKAN